MNRSFLAGLFIAVLISLSGCTSPFGGGESTLPTSTGVDMSLESDYNYISSGDSVNLKLSIQNNGNRDMGRAMARPELLSWSGFNGDQTCQSGLLYKPNIDLKRPGGKCVLSWKVQAPSGLTKEEKFTAQTRVFFDYSTEVTAKVYALTEDALKSYLERGQSAPMVSDISPWDGSPIMVTVLMDSVFITDSSHRQVPVTLKFTNMDSSGYPQSSSSSLRDFTISSVKVETIGENLIGGVDASQCNNVRLKGGSTGDCIVKINVPSTGNKEVIVNLKITTSYTYVKEVNANLIVHPSLK